MITLQATYSKKLGLLNYSSHCFVVSLQTELTDLTQVESESARLYSLLQESVDKELSQVGYLPELPSGNGSSPVNGYQPRNGSNGRRNGKPSEATQTPPQESGAGEPWACSDKQRALILRIVSENGIDKNEVESLSHDLFGVGVRACDKMQASQLIEDLLEKTGKKVNRGSRWRQPARS